MSEKHPIAVVGMSCLFPGASDPDRFWQNLIEKKDVTCQVPASRWIAPMDDVYRPQPMPDKAFSKRACLVGDFHLDPAGLDLAPELIHALDPVHQFVLYAAQQAFVSSGSPYACVSEPDRSRTGVILAAIALPTEVSSKVTREILGSDFIHRFMEKVSGKMAPLGLSPIEKNQAFGARVTSLPAAIVARALGLGGGTYTLDAACASSIYAVKLACNELQAGRADVMLAGGVSRPDCLYTQIGFSQLRALSPSGRCAPFDASADGLVVGEGVGILVLKRLEDAIRDRDRIFAVIRGIGLSNDMRGNLLAPDSEGQLRAMRMAYDRAGWSPSDVDLIECHGAGTPVGDATELVSLKTLWESESVDPATSCPIGSAKSAIGHLLTAAGAAGMIKTLLGMHHATLPPSLNFTQAPENSPLHTAPFHVQTQPEPWHQRQEDIPRRAGISGFGFGGINGHLLLEQYLPQKEGSGATVYPVPSSIASKPVPVAVVGMEAVFGSASGLAQFQRQVFSGDTVLDTRPGQRWRGADAVAEKMMPGRSNYGSWLESITLEVGEFQIPPNEIPDILVQQLLMLKVAASAMADAQMPIREPRPRMGAIIGIEFDMEATNFHLRWYLINEIRKWQDRFHIPDAQLEPWLEQLRDALGPPLTPTRTLGALGGIVASRIAREFKFGGPSFGVSGEATSGIKALEIAVRSIQQGETEAMVVGAVDLAGDIRNVVLTDALAPLSDTDEIYAMDDRARGTLPGEGACALVLKPLDQAIAHGNRIYGIIRGFGNASGSGMDRPMKPETYTTSLKRAFSDAGVSPDSISYIEVHGSGIVPQDTVESDALCQFFQHHPYPCAIGSVKPTIGYTGAASGLASVVKSLLALYQEILPPLRNYSRPLDSRWENGPFHVPLQPQYWVRDRKDGPRRACVAAITLDGNVSHVILEGFEGHQPDIAVEERRFPLGPYPMTMFPVGGDTPAALLEGLEALSRKVDRYPAPGESSAVLRLAREWYQTTKDKLPSPSTGTPFRAITFMATSLAEVQNRIQTARQIIEKDQKCRPESPNFIGYNPEPVGHTGGLAFVFPGSGNHYLSMGRQTGVYWPEILRQLDFQTQRLRTQMVPETFMPWKSVWPEDKSLTHPITDPVHMLFGQVVFGGITARLMQALGVRPSAVIGYSLGESAGLFAMDVWKDRDTMLQRMQATDLFSEKLYGPCQALRTAWKLPRSMPAHWRVAVVNRPEHQVRNVVADWPYVRLLIVNTPDECVIGGLKEQVASVIRQLQCDAIYLDGVVTVHCDAMVPVADEYRALHVLPVNPPADIHFYSCAAARTYPLTSDTVADTILQQALEGFHFPQVIRQAFQDGIRIFLEMGPRSSCTRMISKILENRPHVAISLDEQGQDDYLTLLKCLSTLMAEGVPVNLDPIYPNQEALCRVPKADAISSDHGRSRSIVISLGSPAAVPEIPEFIARYVADSDVGKPDPMADTVHVPVQQAEISAGGADETVSQVPADPMAPSSDPAVFPPIGASVDLIQSLTETVDATSEAHQAFLEFSNGLTRDYGEVFQIQTQLVQQLLNADPEAVASIPPAPEPLAQQVSQPPPAYPREMCMEFAIGSVENVLGPEFAVVDTYPVRVRLPDEPLMLVDRILSVQGEKGALGSGQVITEHDVLPGAWYLDGGKAPVCISVEAGQADLFLCAYLGIDLKVKGKRAYRLLDATVKFHRGLPEPGDVIRYEINIDKFVRQQDTWLFFFRFEGFIGDQHLISMFNGCAGFFTEAEVANSGGIILTEEEKQPVPGKLRTDWQPPVPMDTVAYSTKQVDALRAGDLAGCFGPDFHGIPLAESLWLPHGRMRLIHRVLSIVPNGGRYGLGAIQAEADIHPDDWFLTCHFVDDMVMPGTLMYECCAHTLRVLLLRMGWVTDKPGVCYEPVIGVESVLKCRGPVTPNTKHVVYEVELKEIGFRPEPYVIADAHMYADGHRIVMFRDMSMQMTGLTREEIEAVWMRKQSMTSTIPGALAQSEDLAQHPPALFDRRHILAFAVGKPSEAFGPPYAVFDQDRFIARLPGPPYSFLDRITYIEPEPWQLVPGGWVEAQYDVPADAWYFAADRSGTMPYCVLLEIALQLCGWLAAYLGSALRSPNDLKFRNLGGSAVLYQNVFPDTGTLTIRSRLTKVSEAAEMIIENFDMEIWAGNQPVFKGDTYFGFFTPMALANQVGIREAGAQMFQPHDSELENASSETLPKTAPLNPDDPNMTPFHGLAMPAKALLMIDAVDAYVPDGGPAGLGFIRGVKQVDPEEWFFKAHFYQDPVCPGSLGIESFLQLIRFVAMDRWPQLQSTHRFELITDTGHQWIYRGQIIPKNRMITVTAEITLVEESPMPTIMADGWVTVDGLPIYHMKQFGYRLLPK